MKHNRFNQREKLTYLAGFIWSGLGGDCWSVTGGMGANLWKTLLLRMSRNLNRCSSCRNILNGNAMRGDVVDLTRSCHIDEIVGLNLNLISRWQESIKTHNKIRVALKQL